MHRRTVLRGLGAAVALSLFPVPGPLRALGQPPAAEGSAALPVLMFHKVDDAPRYPEDVSSGQVAALFDALWKQGFCPVNVSDLITGRVDAVVPAGLKPVCLTADDAHPSVLFARNGADDARCNARSLVEVLVASLEPYGHAARGTLFLGRVSDDRTSPWPGAYFATPRPLAEVLDELEAIAPGMETGYHTVDHTRMNGMGGSEVRALMEAQMTDFTRLGVERRVRRLLAYPYGIRPTDQGIAALKALGFEGAVLAFPGVGEGRYDDIPSCGYAGELKSDPFLIPRVCIGAYAYARKGAPEPYLPLDPLEDFRKDVTFALPRLYVSRGA